MSARGLLAALDRRLIDDWRRELFRLWSIRVALFWGALSGLFWAWPAFLGALPPLVFAGLSILMSLALVVARLAKQPGA